MRQVFKPNFIANINRVFLLFSKLIVCQLQPFLSEPSLGSGAKRLTKMYVFKTK